MAVIICQSLSQANYSSNLLRIDNAVEAKKLAFLASHAVLFKYTFSLLSYVYFVCYVLALNLPRA